MPARSTLVGLVTGGLILTLALASCSSDPVQTAMRKQLGPEVPGIDPGEFHRAGQPCLVCHQKGNGVKGEFAIAGTIFWGKPETDAVGVEDAEVLLTDTNGTSRRVRTNCVGNFMVGVDESYSGAEPWPKLAFPVVAAVVKGGARKDMKSVINRDGSCAGCHRIPATADSVGHIFLADTNNNAPPPPECAVDPVVPIFEQSRKP